MTEKEIAQTLLPLIGGKENIVSVMHCAIRPVCRHFWASRNLRFSVSICVSSSRLLCL